MHKPTAYRFTPIVLAASAPLLLLALSGCRSASTPLPDPAPDLAAPPATAVQAPAATQHARVGTDPGHAGAGTPLSPRDGHALAAFAEGCFWGSEDNFRQVPGVVATAVGYSGGQTDNPTYESVCSHNTGHAETVLVEFDPTKVSYEKLLDVFFATHDPTTKDRQGPDIGDQYRSAIFTFSDAQQTAAHAAARRAETSLKKPVTTEIRPMGRFWMAEEYHQQYDEKTGKRSCPLPGGLFEGT